MSAKFNRTFITLSSILAGLTLTVGEVAAQRGPGDRGGGGSSSPQRGGGSSSDRGGGSSSPQRGGGSSGDRGGGSSSPQRGGGSSSGDRGGSAADRAPRRDPGSRGGSDPDIYSPRSDRGAGDRTGGYGRSRTDRNDDNRDIYSTTRTPSRSDRSDAYTRDRRGRDIVDTRPERNRALDIFTRSREGREYNHGVRVRPAVTVYDGFLRPYFPYSTVYYPYYCPPRYASSVVIWSPWSLYVGICPPYLYRERVVYLSPPVVYLDDDVVIYRRGYSRSNDLDDYYLTRRPGRSLRDLPDAVRDVAEDLRGAFLDSNIDRLARLTDPSVKIAVIRKGKYDYSLEANDYLDLTRDMMRNSDTISFDFLDAKRKADSVWTLDFQHIYQDKDNRERTVFVRFAVERILGRWTITQVSTLGDRNE